ncbi:MAG: DUF1634 domain-containing protein [Peptococcaceae bacterium]|nr:DUF1634 domain-containing protein [Peptococcaceae bacterium]
MKTRNEIDNEVLISLSLKVGVYTSAIIVAIGLALFYSSGHSGYAPGVFPTSLYAVYLGLVVGKPAAIVSLGLYLLILTPVFRVAASVFLFFFEKDYLYTAITLFVLGILLFGLFFGAAF